MNQFRVNSHGMGIILPPPGSPLIRAKGDVAVTIEYAAVRQAFPHFLPESAQVSFLGFSKRVINLQGPAMTLLFHDVPMGHYQGTLEFYAMPPGGGMKRLYCRVAFTFQHMVIERPPTKVKVVVPPMMCRESVLR